MPKNTESKVSGRVVEPPEGPQPDVAVMVRDPDTDAGPIATTSTDESGSFSVSVDPPENGKELEVLPSDASGSAKTVSVSPDDGGADVTLVLSDPPTSPDGSGETTMGADVARMMLSGSSDSDAMPLHGSVSQRGMTSVPHRPARGGFGRFGRLLPHLPAAEHDPVFLSALGEAGGPMDGGEMTVPDRKGLQPAGYVQFGQFIDHDITLDPTSSLDRQNDPDALRNFRTPHLDLDSIYGAGSEVDRFLYARPNPTAGDGTQTNEYKFYLRSNDAGRLADLPRNGQGTALIRDPRNDENLVLSQFTVTMLRVHNRLVEELEAAGEENPLLAAQQLLRWHYQWLIIEDFLPRICDEEVLGDILENGRRYFTLGDGERPYIPLEFAGAAYRYGHSQIQESYVINDDVGERDLFAGPGETLRGFRPIDDEEVVDWEYFFDLDDRTTQVSAPIDAVLPSSLLELPFISEGPTSLASRNLVRGRRLGLPSGEAVARAMGETVLDPERSGYADDAAQVANTKNIEPGDEETPLWYYILAEAATLADGRHLGPVGSRIVAETLVGLIESNDKSYRRIQPDWSPAVADVTPFNDELTVGEVLTYASAAE